MELEFRRPLLHEVLIHAGACYVILSCSGKKINGDDIMVILSKHNLRELDDCLCEVEKQNFALHALMEYDVTDPDRRCDFNFWWGLLWDHIDLLDQHLSDLRHLDGAIRKEVDFNLDDSEKNSGDPFFGSTHPDVIHDLGVALMLAFDGFCIDSDSPAFLLLRRLTNECWKRQPLEDESDEA